jgi:hypothetical protein
VPTTDEDLTCEDLDEAECRRLLAASSIGRLGFTDGALPAIVPVPFAMHHGDVLVAARRGSSVVRAVRGAVVAFEVGTVDPASRAGWSVTVVGPSRVVTDPDEVARLDGAGAGTRPPDRLRCYIAIRLGLLRGWRMTADQGRPTDCPPAEGRARRAAAPSCRGGDVSGS